jgi:hypothetical protein
MCIRSWRSGPSKRKRSLRFTSRRNRPIELRVEDEYDMGKLCGHIEELRNMMIRSQFSSFWKLKANLI